MKTERENKTVEDKKLDGSVFHKNMCWQRSYEKPAENEMIMALYGSLRDGLDNSRRFDLPEKSEFLGTAWVEGYTLYSLGAYPAVYPEEGASVLVEVRKFSGKKQMEIAKSIDYMELFGGYHREYVDLEIEGRKLKGIIYVYDDEPRTEKIESGDWVEYMEN